MVERGILLVVALGVDENVDMAVILHKVGSQLLNGFFAGDVAGVVADGAAGLFLDLGARLLQLLLAAARDGNIRARHSETLGDSLSDAAAAANDDRGLTLQREHSKTLLYKFDF